MIRRLIPGLLLALLSTTPALAERPLTLLCNQYPPFSMSLERQNFARDNQVIGIHADAIRALMQRAEVDYNLTLRFPYQRLLEITRKKANTGLFTVDRTPGREPHYRWVGPIGEQRWMIFSREGKVPAVSRLQALTGKTVVAQQGEAIVKTLLTQGINVVPATNNAEALELLFSGKADLWAVSERPGLYLAEQEGRQITEVLALDSAPFYLALNLETDPVLVERLQRTLDAMKLDGSWQAFYDKYR